MKGHGCQNKQTFARGALLYDVAPSPYTYNLSALLACPAHMSVSVSSAERRPFHATMADLINKAAGKWCKAWSLTSRYVVQIFDGLRPSTVEHLTLEYRGN
jgi:hypothetical protein